MKKRDRINRILHTFDIFYAILYIYIFMSRDLRKTDAQSQSDRSMILTHRTL